MELIVAIAGVVLAVLGYLVRLVWTTSTRRQDSIEHKLDGIAAKLDTHIVTDIEAHERIARLEATQIQMGARLQSVGDTSHRFNSAHNEEERKIREWAAAEFSSLQRWITEKILHRP